LPTRKKIRVYELARELGLTNKEALDLCIDLGIGVKSHSSSIEDQQADRVRRKAEREGLRRDVQPEEEVVPVAAKKGPGRQALPDPEDGSARPAPRLVTSRPSASPGPSAPVLTPAPPPLSTAPPVVEPLAPAAAPPAVSNPAASNPTASNPAASGPSDTVAPVVPVQSTGTRPAAPPLSPSPEVRPASPSVPGRPAPSSASPPPPPRPAPPRPPLGAPAPPRPPAGGAPARPAAAGPLRPGPGGPVRPPSGAPPVPSRPPAGPATPAPRPAAPRPTGPIGAPPLRPPTAGAPATTTGPAETRRPPAPPTGSGPPPRVGPPVGASGKPIPPPPGIRRPPTSSTGKPIPPPPGRGPGARPPASAGRPAPTGGPRTSGRPAPSGGGGGFSRPSAPPGAGFGRGPGMGAGPGGRPGGPGAGAPGAARGGPPFGGRGRPPRRRGRRRRNIEELEPTELTQYRPSTAAVPDGEVIVERGSTAQELGPKLNRSGADVVRFLFQQGEMVTTTQSLSDDMIELFAAEVNAAVRLVDPGEEKEAELQAKYFDDDEEEEEDLRPRPPVVTVMGHVDHGKTLLLDRIRETNVVATEAGGITQHIGAYQVDYQGQLITFIDTPGHEAFTAMRARGAEVTDIVILVVAADDGVMPQTVEALNHAKAADVPIIVALNKVDRANADPNRVMQQLSEQGLVPEQWGGDTIVVQVSALQNLGVDDVLEQVLLVAELEELRANPEGRARAVVLEANLDAGKGPMATVIVQNGTLRVGDSVVAGAAWGRVKALIDDNGDNVKEAPPSTPVQVLGFDNVPAAGDELRTTEKGRTARDIAEQREQRLRTADQRRTSSATGTGAKLEDIFEQIQRGETATLNLVLKADTQGSLEAVSESLRKLEREEVKLSFIHRAVGGITENDVTLSAASNATIIGFNVRPDRGARDLADSQDVEIRAYEIIYKLIEDIESAMVGLLKPEYEEVITGEAEVREIFRVPRIGSIAGCYVRSGVITRGSKVRFLRDGVIIWKGAITSLRRFKDDVREVATGFECGIGLTNNQDLRAGDIIETFEDREIPRT
jgi:translation initiation factor IF-2